MPVSVRKPVGWLGIKQIAEEGRRIGGRML